MISKIVSITGALSAAIIAALSVQGFVPDAYAPWLLLASGVLSAIGRRLVNVEKLNNAALAWSPVFFTNDGGSAALAVMRTPKGRVLFQFTIATSSDSI